MECFEFHEEYLKQATVQLELYLRSQVLYWLLGHSRLPFTIGNLLLVLRRLSVLNYRTNQNETRRSALETLRGKDRVFWEKKESAELSACI